MKNVIFSKMAMFVAAAAISATFFASCDKENEDDNNNSGGGTTDVGVVINGVTWATRNVDAPGTFAATPEDAGMFYQWNRKVGWSATDPLENSAGGTTWDSSTPSGTEWEPANDPCPAGWRVPTNEELEKLRDTKAVVSEWITQNEVTGARFSDKNTGKNIFLPASGARTNGSLVNKGSHSHFWSSTQYNSSHAYRLDCYGSSVDGGYYFRNFGFPVRCVQE
jgi:uncharacterized protein (TIGR02145 family)